jgi:diguanylate cyclase (GGDEF)-like protein
MAPSAAGVTASIIDAAGHRVILDSRTPLTSGMPVDQSLTRLAGLAREQGLLAVGADRVAFRRLPSAKGNANNWYVAVAMPSFDAGWTHGLSVRSVALLLAALVTILICVVSGWRQLRTTRRAAYHDVLTGLPNRALLVQRVQASQRTGQPSAVLVLDLEQFKEVNDLLGQSHGDRLLRQIAERLVGIAPTGATVARLGGDDFAMFLPGTDLSAAETAARQCLDALHRTFLIDGTGLDLEARIGVACSPEHGTDAHTLLRHADTAMYLAKEGHDGCRTYDTAVEQHAPKRLALLGDLRRALEADDQITLHYQPKVGIAHGHLAGVEALVRWQHPQLGRIAPDAFIPLAETTTLIHALTTRVLETAVRQARQWQDEGLDIPVAVNLSTRCLHDPGLPDRVFDLLRRTGLPAALLELEITESMVMSDPEQALTVLHALHDGGIRLSVDDFGTGHSSMAYLQRMPVDELKIDKSFVQHLLERDENSVLVRSAITLGHNLGLSVVAEGVEDEATVDVLRDLDCDVVQGYHFARPMAADDLRAWLRTRTTAVH